MTTTTQPKEHGAQHVTLPVDLRDYFAAKAMQAILAGGIARGEASEQEDAPLIAKAAWFMADAMLKERA